MAHKQTATAAGKKKWPIASTPITRLSMKTCVMVIAVEESISSMSAATHQALVQEHGSKEGIVSFLRTLPHAQSTTSPPVDAS
jgi:hypothetical protein